MKRITLNGKPQSYRCPTHRDMTVVLYGLPDATAWCRCGREMRKSRNIK
jgi:hypothetical protein